MRSIIESGTITDIMLAFVALEVVLLLLLYRWRRIGVPPLGLLLNVGAGGSLMLALRSTLYDHGWQAVAAFLISALICHVADLAYRWRSAAPKA
ncbi:MAG: hypothetical protein AAF648_15885 [Pseudomonadota bacterium]